MDKRFLFLLPIVSGCLGIPSVGPNYKEPTNPTVLSWEQPPGEDTLFTDSHSSHTSWWAQLNDPVLNDLINGALKSNPSYEIASSRLREARANSDVARAPFFPFIDGRVSATRSAVSQNSPNAQFINSPTNSYQAGFDASWEIDIFGGNRRVLEAAGAEEEGAEASLDDAGISVAAEVARNYVELRSFEKRVEIADNNLKIQTDSRDLVKIKFDAGISSELDLAQAASQLEATRANIPLLNSELKRRIYRLAGLCGVAPQNFILPGGTAIIPKLQGAVKISQPSEFLRTRPDIRIAERGLAAQNARIGVAVADLFPKIALIGSLGVQSNRSGSLFDDRSRTWSIGPHVTLPIFHAGQILANINVQDERAQQAFSRYEQTVLGALEEAQNALNSYSFELDRVKSLEKSFAASNRALEISKELYAQGLVDFLRVIEAQRASLASQDSLVESQARVALTGIGVYKAFAGGLPNEVSPQSP